MIGVLNGTYQEFFSQFLLLHLVLDTTLLSQEEKGYLYYSVLDANFRVLNRLVSCYTMNASETLPMIKENFNDQREKEYQTYLIQKQDLYRRFFREFGKREGIGALKEIMMDLDLPAEVQEDLLSYYKTCHPVKQESTSVLVSTPNIVMKKEEKRVSKKELKMCLKEYYDEQDEMKPFDFLYYEQVISILKQLNYSENHIVEIISVLLRNRIDNYSYYLYVVQKYAHQFPENHFLNEVREAWQNMVIPETEEDYDFYKEYILENISWMEQGLVGNYEYDLKRVYSKK